jgi:EmrB/QacA subfamily drug resistance transporter
MLPVVLSATFMALFDFFVVNIAAPSLQSDLHTGEASLELIVGGYAFTYAACLVSGGRLGDLFGYRRLFLIGMTTFTIASALCGLAATPGQLIAARLLQGVTAAAMVPQVLALITAVFPPEERPRALSWFGVTIGAGSVAGQVLGGLLLDADLFGLGWRAIFLVNVPVGVLALAFAARLLPPLRGQSRPRLDPVGAAGLATALALALVPLVFGRSAGWPVWTWVSLALSVPALIAVVSYERALANRGGHPLLDLELFRNRVFAAGLGINLVFMAFFGSFMFGLTLLLQAGLRLEPLEAGLTFGPLGLVFAVTSVAAQRLVARFGPRIITLGTAVSALGLLGQLTVLELSGPAVSVRLLMAPMLLVGLGNGLTLPALVGAVLSRIEARHAGGAAGILTTVQQFAGAIGVAVLGSAFFSALGEHPSRGDYASALGIVTAADVALVVLGMALTWLLRPSRVAAPSKESVGAAELIGQP